MRTAITLIGLMWMLVGCTTFEQNTYKTLGTVAITVDATMNGWGDYVRMGKATPEQEQSVRDAYGKYQIAMRLANTAITTYRLSGDKPALETALAALNSAKDEIITLILTMTK
jgi:hypothetical protein